MILTELKALLDEIGIPSETGIFSDPAPDCYIVLTPISDTFGLYADNAPGVDIQEVRLSLFCKGNYIGAKNAVSRKLMETGFTITDRRYIGRENDTGYHHYAIDAAKYYEMEET